MQVSTSRPARALAWAWSNPVQAVHRHVLPRLGRRVAYMVGFSTWKHAYLRRYLADRALVFLPRELSAERFRADYRAELLARDSELCFWGMDAPEYLLDFAREHRIPTRYVEDGFVRSVALGASYAVPMSLCIDARGQHFDAHVATDLETLLSNYDFAADPALAQRAARGIEMLIDAGLSKYNGARRVDLARLYGPKTARRVLVVGQVETDASIRYGCDRPLCNNDVVRLAAAENPGAQILFKPHPDVLAGLRALRSDPREVASICRILGGELPLAQALETVDHVYTISSLAGFEALLRGIRVTTLGCPFYAGWGLTDDRQPQPRRRRRLSVQQLFAGAYLLYPRYFDLDSGRPAQFEDVVRRLRRDLQPSAPRVPAQRARAAVLPRNALSLYVP